MRVLLMILINPNEIVWTDKSLRENIVLGTDMILVGKDRD